MNNLKGNTYFSDSYYIDVSLRSSQVEYLQSILKSVINCEFTDDVYISKAKEILELISKES